MDETISQVEGINSNDLDAGSIDTNVTTDVEATEESKETKAKGKSNIPKILAEKNKYKKLYEEANAKLEGTEFGEDKVQAMIDAAVAKAQTSQIETQEKNEFLTAFGEENLAKVEEVKALHPTLSYGDAAKLAGIAGVTEQNPTRLSFAGNTPSSLKKQRTTADLSDAELKAGAEAELKAMMGLQ